MGASGRWRAPAPRARTAGAIPVPGDSLRGVRFRVSLSLHSDGPIKTRRCASSPRAQTYSSPARRMSPRAVSADSQAFRGGGTEPETANETKRCTPASHLSTRSARSPSVFRGLSPSGSDAPLPLSLAGGAYLRCAGRGRPHLEGFTHRCAVALPEGGCSQH